MLGQLGRRWAKITGTCSASVTEESSSRSALLARALKWLIFCTYDIGTFHTAASVMRLEVSDFLSVPFKRRVSVSHSPLPDRSPVHIQSQMLWGLAPTQGRSSGLGAWCRVWTFCSSESTSMAVILLAPVDCSVEGMKLARLQLPSSLFQCGLLFFTFRCENLFF